MTVPAWDPIFCLFGWKSEHRWDYCQKATPTHPEWSIPAVTYSGIWWVGGYGGTCTTKVLVGTVIELGGCWMDITVVVCVKFGIQFVLKGG